MRVPGGNSLWRSGLFLLLAVAGFSTLGCREKAGSSSDGQARPVAGASTGQWREELFTYAMGNLERLEEFDSAEVGKQLTTRIGSLQQTGQLPGELHGDSLLATWPEPELLHQIVNRLNQWAENQEPLPGWKRDGMVDRLPPSMSGMACVKNLDQLEFSYYDGFALQEAVWLRDASAWARGKKQDRLDQARSLFDWVVRNIQLEADSSPYMPQVPWETLLLGRGTAMDRAWLMILLCRQQGIDAAMLAVPESAGPSLALPRPEKGQKGKPRSRAASMGRLRPWCVGVLVDGKVFLFDPRLGIPLPAPEGVRREAAGQLEIMPATLAEVRKDPGLLRRLDLRLDRPYPFTASDLDEIVVLVEASPAYLSMRMQLLESRLTGKQRMVLSTNPEEQAARFKKAVGTQEAGPWSLPFTTLRRRLDADLATVHQRLMLLTPFFFGNGVPLYKGRVLLIKGRLDGPEGAIVALQQARPPNSEIDAAHLRPDLRALCMQTKYSASYWLGLVAWQQGNYTAAVDYFTKRTLDAFPDGAWTPGARYSLGRTYEALGQPDKAIEQYDASQGPDSDGGLLRARWLKELGTGEPPKESLKETPKETPKESKETQKAEK